MATNRADMTPEERATDDKSWRIAQEDATQHLEARVPGTEETRVQALKTLEAVITKVKSPEL